MPRILIIENDHNQIHLYTMILENLNPSIEIVDIESVNVAISLLSEGELFDIIISESILSDGDSYKLYKFMDHKKLDIPVIIATAEDTSVFLEDESFMDSQNCRIIEKPITEPLLRSSVEDYIDFDLQTSFDPDDVSERFCKVKTLYFLRFNKTQVPIYIRLNNTKYVRLFNDNYDFGPEEVQRYLSRGLDYLYISKKDFEEFKVSIGSTPFLSQVDDGSTDLSDQAKWARTQAVLSSLLMTCGVSGRALKKSFANIDNVKTKLQTDPDLKTVSELVTSDENFYSDHCLLTAIFAGLILEKLEWNSDANLEKILLGSLLHDSTLDVEIANVMEAHDMDSISEISKQDQDKYFSHSKDASDLVNENDAIHNEVSTIILEHHEKPDGSGFPRGLTSKHIHPLSSVFIFAHDLVEQMYSYDFDPSKTNLILKYMKETYYECHFESAYTAFLKIFNIDDSNQEESEEVSEAS
ncbi:MAG: HD domain-containing protein [Bacteriovoracaceae bacterium]|nr:HD domain-containing protein [Bacteriovoracaceae bacterium]